MAKRQESLSPHGIPEKRGRGVELRRKGNEERREGRTEKRGEGRDVKAHEYYNDRRFSFHAVALHNTARP